MALFQKCVPSGNIHTPPMEVLFVSIPHPSRNSSLASYFSLQIVAFHPPSTPIENLFKKLTLLTALRNSLRLHFKHRPC